MFARSEVQEVNLSGTVLANSNVKRKNITDVKSDDDRLVLVCEKCLQASCWYGEFRCSFPVSADIGLLSVRELKALTLENPYNWTLEKFEKIYGRAIEFEEGSIHKRLHSDV